MTPRRTLLAVCLLYAGLALSVARGFPPVNSDEVVRTVMSRHWIHGEPSRYSLYDDIFAQPVYALRDVLPEISLTIYHTWLGAWTGFRTPSTRNSRLSSIAAGILALVMFYALGVRLGGVRMGLWCALLAGFNPLFLMASFLARPETLLLATFTGLLGLTVVIPERIRLKPFFIGGLGMLQMGIHPNASILCLGLFIFYLFNVKGRARFSQGALFAVGALSGLLLALTFVDARRWWLGMHTIHAYLLRPPIIAGPWAPFAWLHQTLRVMWYGITFYFDDTVAPGWMMSVKAWWIAMVLLILIARTQPREETGGFEFHRWLAAAAAVFIGSVALVKAKECLYVTNFLPFLIPIAAAALSRPAEPLSRAVRGLAGVLAAFSLFLFLNFARLYTARVKPYEQIMSEVRAMLPQGRLKVAGPNVLWFAWDKELFRDSGAILLSHWYTRGQRDLKTWLEPWRPDILILDHATQIALGLPNALQKNLTRYLGCPVDRLGAVDSPGAYGHWEVFRVRWRST